MNNPLELFTDWLGEAHACSAIAEPTAMSLATADAAGMPSCRIVLLKEADERGFVFYTNQQTGRKSLDIFANPHAALCFYWMPLDKQIRIQGRVEKVSNGEADAYFASRNRNKQLGAWASLQSTPLSDRTEFDARLREYEEKFSAGDVPRPPHWSGWRVVPTLIEFWIQHPDRWHQRWVYRRESDASEWNKTLLYP